MINGLGSIYLAPAAGTLVLWLEEAAAPATWDMILFISKGLQVFSFLSSSVTD